MFTHHYKSMLFGFAFALLFLCTTPYAIATNLTTVPQTQTSHSANSPLITKYVQVKVKVANQSSKPATDINVQIPLISANSPYQQTYDEKFNYDYETISVDKLGNRMAAFNIDSLDVGQAKTIVIDYALKIKPDGGLVNNDMANIKPFLQASEKIESNHPEIIAVTNKINANAGNDVDKVKNISDFVNAHMKYNLNAPGSNQGALSALRSGEGVCEDFAALFVALCRAADIPARPVNGYADPKLTGESWNKENTPLVSLKGYRHCWAEVYVDGKGWLAVDPTFKIYPESDSTSSLTQSHIAQNYCDSPVKLTYQGEKLAVGWGNLLVNK